MSSLAGNSDSRPRKRAKKTHYHDRVPLEDDLEVIHTRSSRLTGRNVASESVRSPQKGRITWTIGSAWAPEDDTNLALDQSGDWFDEEMGAEVFESGPSRAVDQEQKKARVRSGTSTRPHVFWKKQHRDEYLDEDIRWEGRGDFRADSGCPDCASRKRDVAGPAEYRCLDCFLPDLCCRSCCVKRHQRLPFHIIERWTGDSFVKVSLKNLGLVIHLNHASMRCPAPAPCHQDFKVIHTNGVHEVALSYCGCHRAIPRHLQLLRRGLYPASQITTHICATFSLLRLLHLLSLTSKASTYDLYRALERLTDNVGDQDRRSRYRAFLRIGLQWRHLKLLKRGGRGHDEAGVSATKDGELAIMCPSCPHPGINLPDGWDEAPEEQRFIYSLLVCLDANFRLKNQLVSNYSSDPGLGTGWAYMVGRESYERYILNQVDADDVSTCVGFLALAQALTRFSRGLRYTGVGGAFCGRGEMILPNGIGDLQKGERYANMDYIFASAVRSSNVASISISYDISCQWYRNLDDRMKCWPADLRLKPQVETRPLIPKFHEPAHSEKDHEQYSFNFATGVGKSDGEVPERVWAGHNGLGGSTKTHGPGSRHDILDDHFGFWNWQKYCGMGATLMRRYKAAIAERNRQVEAHRGFTESLPPSMVKAWEEMCINWDADGFPKAAPNPFAVEGTRISQAGVKEELAKEEKIRAQQVPPLHTTGPSTWLAMGLELEDSQRRLRARFKVQNISPTELQALKEQRIALARNIRNWEPLCAVYMPGLLQYQADVGVGGAGTWEADPNPEEVDLFLPSRLPSDRRNAACVVGLPEVEARLRTAQCHDALASLRRTLRLKARMVQFKNRNIRGQKQSTRSRALIDRVHQRALTSVDMYRAAREALLAISGPGDWEKTLQLLLNGDVRSYVDTERRQHPARAGIWEDGVSPAPAAAVDGDINALLAPCSRREGTGQTKNIVSWIWRTGSAHSGGGGGEGDDDVMRSEWSRSRARVQRCKEEVLLLLEEMRRVLQFLDWRARWWDARQKPRAVGAELQEGLRAYAVGQAAVQRQLSSAFQAIWKTPLNLVNDQEDCEITESDDDDDDDEDGGVNNSDGGDGADGGEEQGATSPSREATSQCNNEGNGGGSSGEHGDGGGGHRGSHGERTGSGGCRSSNGEHTNGDGECTDSDGGRRGSGGGRTSGDDERARGEHTKGDGGRTDGGGEYAGVGGGHRGNDGRHAHSEHTDGDGGRGGGERAGGGEGGRGGGERAGGGDGGSNIPGVSFPTIINDVFM